VCDVDHLHLATRLGVSEAVLPSRYALRFSGYNAEIVRNYRFYARWQNYEKRLLASSCLSVWNNGAPTGQILTKFYI
jgi:hypothetical protein